MARPLSRLGVASAPTDGARDCLHHPSSAALARHGTPLGKQPAAGDGRADDASSVGDAASQRSGSEIQHVASSIISGPGGPDEDLSVDAR